MRKADALFALDPGVGQQAITILETNSKAGLQDIHNQDLFNAAMAGDTAAVEQIIICFYSYLGTITELKSKTADLPGLFTGDAKAIERGLIEIERAASKADELAENLVRVQKPDRY